MEIIKADGKKEEFSKKKLLRSLRHSGATAEVAENVARQVEDSMQDNMKTKDIYRKAFEILRRGETLSVAHKYNLRNALMELGPEGFVFEKFIGEIFKALGYTVKVGVIIQGWCIEHEVDVSAKKDGKHILVECKFHNTTGFKTDLKVALYVRERFQDIEKKHEHDNAEGSREHEGWLITNTKLTTKAIQYSLCCGQKVVGWGYPSKGHGNLEDLIEEAGVHPIGILTLLSKQQRKLLMQNGVVVCRQIRQDPNVLRAIGIQENRIPAILKEVNMLCVP